MTFSTHLQRLEVGRIQLALVADDADHGGLLSLDMCGLKPCASICFRTELTSFMVAPDFMTMIITVSFGSLVGEWSGSQLRRVSPGTGA